MLVRKAAEQRWKPIDIAGVEYCRLRENENQDGGATIVRMRKGVSYPAHRHPGWEQALVWSGRVTVGGEKLGAGDYWYAEAGEVHAAFAEEDLTFFVITEKEIEVIKESSASKP